MEREIYQRLGEHLDRLPGGFPPSTAGADLALLEMLFTPEQAELATHLTLDREDARTIAERAGLPLAEAQPRLDEMARSGLIFSAEREDGRTIYQAVPFVVGIYEFQVNRLSETLRQKLADYWRTVRPRPPVEALPQTRTIPVGESVAPHLEALPYEQVDALLDAHDRFAVAPCICRRAAKLRGEGCDAPEESCLMFGEWADYYVRGGMGRTIDRAEVNEVLARADAANLVLQPSNSTEIAFICCCCGCCCGVLAGLKRHPRPAEAVVSAFVARLEPDLCQGCWTCLERCQMEALTEDGDRVSLNADRCIGCGLCVSSCPDGALTLVRKPGGAGERMPATLDATWRAISQARAESGISFRREDAEAG
jgi:ferredoxin